MLSFRHHAAVAELLHTPASEPNGGLMVQVAGHAISTLLSRHPRITAHNIIEPLLTPLVSMLETTGPHDGEQDEGRPSSIAHRLTHAT